MNMTNTPSNLARVSETLQIISNGPRLEIIAGIGAGEVCVCHLEAMLGLRQATLSQHLMALREAGVVTDRREGRYIFYRLCDPALLGLVRQAAQLQGLELPSLAPSPDCDCPNCSSEASGETNEHHFFFNLTSQPLALTGSSAWPPFSGWRPTT